MSIAQSVGNSYCCGASITTTTITYKYREGSLLYSVQAANKGRMERVAIKRVRLVNNYKTFGKTIAIYIDTLNGLWNEDMLCLEADAQSMAISYLQIQQQKLMTALEC